MNNYDRVRYVSRPLAQTHPDRLATIAQWFGMTVAPPEHCRVLELGCASGGNLIPMALVLPQSTFTGIDRTTRAIGEGRAMANALALGNVGFLPIDLLEAGPELGEFDYIIAHGLYSWVPENARERLLDICRANLGPNGIAYVSYNAYPGFHRREMFREMILYRLESVKDAGEHRPCAIEFIDWLGRCGTQTPFMRALVAEELRHLKESDWWYVCHDDLEADNHAVYFHEFVDRVRAHGLEYLGEADFFEMQDDIYAEPVAEALQRLTEGDVIRKEQYLDFIKGRAFRQTLLCRKEVKLTRVPRAQQITSLHVSSDANPISAAPNLGPGVAEEFRNSRGGRLRTEDCQVKRALVRLSSAWPQSVAFTDLHAEVGDESAPLAAALFQAYRAGVIEARISPDRFTAEVGKRPVASPLARLQARDGDLVTTLRHTTAELADDVDRHLVSLLDGPRDRAELIEALRTELRTQLNSAADTATPEWLEMRLTRLAKQALLMA